MKDIKLDLMREIASKKQFELSYKMPISWEVMATTLKHSADKLYDLFFNAKRRQHSRLVDELDKLRKEEQGITHRILDGEELEDFWDGRLITIYYLLMGYAIENLLKGIYLAQHPEKFDPDKRNNWIKSHDLEKWCVNKCKIQIDERERNWLKKLQRIVLWQGKYPVPLGIDQMRPAIIEDESWDLGAGFEGRQYQDELNNLYEKILFELDKIKSERDQKN